VAREGKAPAFPFYAADWLADLKMSLAGHEAKGVFVDLLCFAWREGGLPTDEVSLAEICRLHLNRFRPVWKKIGDRFVHDSSTNRLVSARMEAERKRQEDKREKNTRAAKVRWDAHANASVSHVQDQSGRSAPASETHSPAVAVAVAVAASSTNTESASPQAALLSGQTRAPKFDFDAVYSLYPRKEGKTRGMKLCREQISKEADYQSLRKAVANYAAGMRGVEVKFIKHFATFMGCWRDYLDVIPAAAATTVAPARAHKTHEETERERADARPVKPVPPAEEILANLRKSSGLKQEKK